MGGQGLDKAAWSGRAGVQLWGWEYGHEVGVGG